MAFNAYEIVHPSLVLPQTLLQISQRSGAFETLAGGKQLTMLSATDQYVYIKTLQMRGAANVGQAAANQLDGPAFVTKMIQTPTYLIRARAQYDHHDTAAAGNWDVALPEAYRRAMWQTFAQNERSALLYGFQPANGEGLLNANGATAVTLPADSNGNTTFLTYDNGEMAIFILEQLVALQTRMFQATADNRFVILGPQRILAAMQLSNIVQVTQFQRAGAGTASTGQVVNLQGESAGANVVWVYDDTLIGKGAGGTDAIVIVCPEVEKQEGSSPDTNAFAGLMPSLDACTLQLTDMPAPREIMSPLAGGATDCLYEKRVTPGWAVRPEAVTIVSMEY